MKMETPILAHRSGRLRHAAAQGSYIQAGMAIARIEPAA